MCLIVNGGTLLDTVGPHCGPFFATERRRKSCKKGPLQKKRALVQKMGHSRISLISFNSPMSYRIKYKILDPSYKILVM